MKIELVSTKLRRRHDRCRRLYPFLGLAAAEEKWGHIEWGFETLKFLYSEGVAERQDAGRLGSLVRQVADLGKSDCALALLSGFVPLYRHNPSCREEIVGALSVIALHAYRNRQPALMAKCGDYLCRIAIEEESVVDELVRAVKQVGILAVRGRDEGLFREMMMRMMKVFFMRTGSMARLTSLLTAWLERILHQDGEACYEAWRSCLIESLTKGQWTNCDLLALMESCRSMAGLAAMNPYSPVMRRFLSDILYYAELQEDKDVQITAVQIVGMAMRIAVHDYPAALSMPYIVPLSRFGGNQAWRQARFPMLYETGEGRVLTAVWQVFLLLEKELEENRWQEEGDLFYPVYDAYQTTYPLAEREVLFWRSFFAYRKKVNGKTIPRKVGVLTKKERADLLRT
ncbi:MAG: hypothetical protein IJN28_06070 [Selenomonadales bacterium]|nr:hypothetical protein [Selenomonadales bacterium]MBQ6713333.1 hypothetical protein [Selenomonadales bacterium]